MAVNSSRVHTTTLLLASVCREELCSPFVVPAVVHTAALSDRDALIPVEDESSFADAAFNAWSIARAESGKIVTGGRAAIST